jgi:glycosyltransferase involved in cell wall biosynthesis
MNLPKISIVTPSYNQAQFLEKTILSVLDQGYPKLQYIIMDGGSTDGSLKIIQKYEKFLHYYQSKVDGGQSAAINDGFKRASGQIFGWLNSDDSYIPGALKIVGEILNSNPDCMWCSGGQRTIRSNNRIIGINIPEDPLDTDFILKWPKKSIHQAATFWHASLWRKCGGLDTSLNYTMDLDLWLKFANHGFGIPIDKILSEATTHGKAKSVSRYIYCYIEACGVFYKHGYSQKYVEMINDFPLPKWVPKLISSRMYKYMSRIYKAFIKWL